MTSGNPHRNRPQPHALQRSARRLRWRAARAVGRAYFGRELWWLAFVLFLACSLGLGIQAAQAVELGSPLLVALFAFLTALCLILAVGYVPAAIALTVLGSAELYYLDTGSERAALCVRRTRRRARPDDHAAHTFGAWPRNRGAGRQLGSWVVAQIHQQGPTHRVTATALPSNAERYQSWGMLEVRRKWWGLLVELASRP